MEYPGELVPTDQLSGGFMARQRVTAHHGRGSTSFEGILQLAEGTLLLVGLTPFGTKAFVVQQRGLEVDLQVHVPVELPFSPRNVLLDIHRTLFIGVPGAPHADGIHESTRAGERIVEHWRDARLRKRTFTRTDGDPPGTIVVTYGDAGLQPGVPPPKAKLQNGWFDYRLEIETLELTLLSQD
jgi:hypothetical protein